MTLDIPAQLPEGASIGDDGVWAQVVRADPGAADARARPALFLDRDGTVIEEAIHLSRPDGVVPIDGAAQVIARANSAGIPVVLVTNQSGIGRGLFGWNDFIAVQERVLALLDRDCARVDAVFACPHHRDAKPPYDHPDHPDRKPNPGLVLRAIAALGLDARRSWIAGDCASDIAAGRRAGLMGGLHVATGFGRSPGERQDALAQARTGGYEVRTAASVAAAAELLPLLLRGDGVA
jgi:D-glycero-D-manno-heptose 1,7-bisphosphate phosphatase